MQQPIKMLFAARKDTVDGVSGGAAVKPQRNRLKPELPKPEFPRPEFTGDGKPDAAKPERKKTVVQRRAPARGKYIDEYAGSGV